MNIQLQLEDSRQRKKAKVGFGPFLLQVLGLGFWLVIEVRVGAVVERLGLGLELGQKKRGWGK